MNPSHVEIRQFILDTFSEEDFELFCADYFPQAKNDFSDSMGFRLRAQKLIEYCQNREIVENLIAALQKERPPAYTRRFGQVSPTLQEIPETTQAQAMVRNPRQIYISHAHEDAAFAHRLAEDLQQRGWVSWITPDSIHPGEKWVPAIQRGLNESAILLVVVTPRAIASTWVNTEVESAIELEHEKKMRLIPVLTEPGEVPILWRRYQRVSFIDDYNKGLAQLIAALEPSRPIVPAKSVEPPSWHEAIVPTQDLTPKAQHQAEAAAEDRVRPGAARKVHEEQDRSGADDLEHGAPDTVAHPGQKESHNQVSVPDQTAPHVRAVQERSAEARWIAEPVKAVEAGQPGQPTGAYLPDVSTPTRKLPRRGLFAAVIALVVLSASAVLFAATSPSTNTPNTPHPTITSVPVSTDTPAPIASATAEPGAVVMSPPNELVLTLAPGVTMTLVRIPADEYKFMMGSDPTKDKDAKPDEQPQHRVDVSDFYIGRYEVTNAQYDTFAKATNRKWEMPVGKQDHPVVYVSWDDAVAFCEWVSQVVKRNGVRLPTEAEWEKAARGTDGRIYSWGDEWDAGRLNSREGGVGGPAPIGKYSPAGDSPYGVADMAGNVREWTADWYSEDEYKNRVSSDSPIKDPAGPPSGEFRVLRGGSWSDNHNFARAASREGHNPSYLYYSIGFRVVLDAASVP